MRVSVLREGKKTKGEATSAFAYLSLLFADVACAKKKGNENSSSVVKIKWQIYRLAPQGTSERLKSARYVAPRS